MSLPSEVPSSILWIGPAASGKTQACIDRVRAQAHAAPLTPIWALLPDGHQVAAFRRRLLSAGGAFGVRVGTFDDLYTEILALADAPLPIAPEPVLHRLIQSVLDRLAEEGALKHYAAIRRRPGLALALNDLFAELKRSRVDPVDFEEAVSESEPRLRELAAAYARYQATLIHVDWADGEGRGWLAIEALEKDQALASGWHVVVDGFDSFTATQRETLKLLQGRANSLAVTLMGEGDLSRSAYRRFQTTLAILRAEDLALATRALPARRTRPAALRNLADLLFVEGSEAARAGRSVPGLSADLDTRDEQTGRDPLAGPVAFLEAQTQALEAREALRWLKARHLRDGVPLADCAVIARDLDPYVPYLSETTREFGLPLALASGASLETNPAVGALLNVLSLPLSDWERRSVLDVIRSPYIDVNGFGLERRDVARVEAVSRVGQVIAGVDQWREAFEIAAAEPSGPADAEREALDEELTPPTLPRGEPARALGAGLMELITRLTPPEQSTLRGYVAWVEDLIEALRLETAVRQQFETAARDQAALVALREVFSALVLSGSLFGQDGVRAFAEFQIELRGAVAAARYFAGPRPAGAILAADLRRARGVPYAAVAVLGLAEGLFPAALSEDPFLSDEERQALQERGLPLEPRLRSDQQSLFYEAVTRAERYLLLTRPYLADDGESWQPSPFWQAARAVAGGRVIRVRQGDPRAPGEAASLTEALAEPPPGNPSLGDPMPTLDHLRSVLAARLAPQIEGPHEGDLTVGAAHLAVRYGPEHVWSPSRLEAYGACGFRFFVGSALGLEPRVPPRVGLDSAQLGTLLHAILENVYRAAARDDVTGLIAALPAVAAPIFAAAPRELGFRPTRLWARQQTELLDWLKATLQGLAEIADGFVPVAFEQRFSRLQLDTSAGPVRIRGVIDRVDRNNAGEVRVIDYKTGSSHLDPGALIHGIRLQLPLYAAAAQDELALGRPVDGLYWAVRRAEAGRLRLAEFEFTADDGQTHSGVPGAIALAADHIANSVRGIRAGRFQPVPPRDGCPEYCPAAAFCWRYSPER